jgi:hypothetical protein
MYQISMCIFFVIFESWKYDLVKFCVGERDLGRQPKNSEVSNYIAGFEIILIRLQPNLMTSWVYV